MTPIAESNLQDDPYLKVLRPLIEAHSSLLRRSNRHIGAIGLTSSQFDVIVSLGGTDGLSCKELSERTLITKGTLTGVLDRLVLKGYLERQPSHHDRRMSLVKLTPEGDALFQKIFPLHLGYLRPYLQKALSPSEINPLCEILQRLKESLDDAS
jgi:MarR family transcriptional regulator, 2-MHQ and catechol-resistance regulon repressor